MFAVFLYLVVQVRRFGAACTTYKADHIATFYLLSWAYIVLAKVSIERFVAIAMVYTYMLSITRGIVISTGNHSIASGIDRSACRGGEVHTIVEFSDLCERVGTETIARCHTLEVFVLNGLNSRKGL